MAGLKRFNYTGKDHDLIVDDSINKIKEVYGSDKWNDFEEDSTGRMLIEAYAFVTDLLLFYLDRQANESYLITATERQNVINHCKLIGYTPKNAKPSQVIVTVYMDEPKAANVILPSGSVLESRDGLVFETQSEAVIKAGELSVDVLATEGETFDEIIGTSSGDTWQEFYLPRSGIIEIISAEIDYHSWSMVESLADQSENSEVFSAEIDAWRRATISFGDGRTGKVPPKGENIKVKYRVGGGIAGNIAPNTITTIRDIAQDTNGNKVTVKVTNRDWASGGEEPESIERIKLWAPRYFETQNRCVTQQDYETFATKFDGICKARAVVRERTGEANVIRIYVLSYGTQPNTVTTANQILKDNLLEYLNHYNQLTDWLEISDGSVKPVDFEGNIRVNSGFQINSVVQNVKQALIDFMNVDIRDMGEPLRISDVYSIINGVEGVTFVELITPLQTVTAENCELLTLGDVTFYGSYH